tara:strand:- start:109 stop:525 length:417 start_codon:yes stop_codon:yes gene_type:complete
MKKTLCIAFLTFLITPLSNNLNAQSLSFSYDEAGNRTLKQIILSKENESRKKTEFEEQLDSITFKIYPNPTSDLLNIELSKDKKESISYYLIDINGKILTQGVIYNSGQINLSQYSDGVYFLELIGVEEKTSWRILKK